ncbi:MAG: lipopolysaccharide biosynthesis protein [Flavobacteriales bacterium]
MNPLKKLLGQTAIYGLSSIIGRLLNFLLVPLYTRYFSPSEYGEVSLLYAYVAFFVVILIYGMETSFFRFCSHKVNVKKVFSTTLFSVLFSSSLFVFLVASFSSPIATFLQFEAHPEYVVYFAFILGLDAISTVSFAKLRYLNKAILFASIRLINIAINIGLNLFFIVYCPMAVQEQWFLSGLIAQFYDPTLGIAYIFIANLIASLVMLLLLIPQMKNSSITIDFSLLRKMLLYGLPLMVAGLAGIANETIDRVILQYVLPSEIAKSEIGIYSAFYKLSIIMTLFVQAFRFGAEPFFFAQQKEKNAKQLYAQTLKFFIIVTSAIFLVTMIYFDLVKHFIGQEFHDSRGMLVVPILLLANLFLGIYYNLSVWFKLSNNTIYGAYLAIFGACLTIALNLLWIPSLGFVGAAWATLVCYVSMTIASYVLSKKHYAINYPIARILLYLLLSIAFYMLSLFVDLGMALNSIYIVCYFVVVYRLEKSTKQIFLNP